MCLLCYFITLWIFFFHFFHFLDAPNMCISWHTQLIFVDCNLHNCFSVYLLFYFKGNTTTNSNKTKTNQQVMWSMSSLGNSIQIGLLHSLGILLFYFYCGTVEKGRIDTKAHTRTPQSTRHIFNGFGLVKKSAPNWNLRMRLSSKFQTNTHTHTTLYCIQKEPSICYIL